VKPRTLSIEQDIEMVGGRWSLRKGLQWGSGSSYAASSNSVSVHSVTSMPLYACGTFYHGQQRMLVKQVAEAT